MYGRYYVIKALTFDFDNWELITIGLVKAGEREVKSVEREKSQGPA